MLIVHLSDIHFKSSDVETALDPNHNLRNEVLRDLRAHKEKLGPADILVVSGDVAFAGKTAEFDFATEWLKQACDACGAKFQDVFVIPGNHDVDRSASDGTLVQLLHNSIKDVPADASPDDLISSYLRKPQTAALLYESLTAYNTFASRFLCDMLPPNRTRAKREYTLNDDSTLRLWGINSAFVSSSSDEPHSIFVDPATFQITRHPDVVNLVVTHHHFSWLRQHQAVLSHFADVAPIQMFGHIHSNQIDRDPSYMRLTASAVHPDRSEQNWEPGYNILELRIEHDDDGRNRRLHLRAHVRVWQRTPGQFRAKFDRGNEVFEHRIDLEDWKASDAAEKLAPLPQEDVRTPEPEPSPEVMTMVRELILRFHELTFSQKSEIAGRLALLEEADMAQPDYERFRQVFFRANAQGKLADLERAIEEAEGRSEQ